MSLDARARALCSAPAGCAFLLVVEANDLAPELAARPDVAMHVAAVASNELSIWRGDHEEIIAAALEQGGRLEPLAQRILTQPAAAWWFAPVDRAAQWVILRPGDHVTPDGLITPTSPPTDWERYAQKPEGAEYSSTVTGGTCSILAAMEHLAGDYYPVLPIGRVRLRASPLARVYEVDGPLAWHQLALRYPTLDDDGRVVPNWGDVATDWDAVHLTLGGLLTAEQVRVCGPTGWTELRAWDAEQTAWLRWCFEEAVRLADLSALPPPPVPVEPPPALFTTASNGQWWAHIAPDNG